MDLELYLINKIYSYLYHPNAILVKEYFMDKYASEIMDNYILDFELNFRMTKEELAIFTEYLDKYAWYPYELYINKNEYHLVNLLDYI